MNLLRLSFANLTVSPLSSAVNILLLALGTASIAALLLANTHLASVLQRNAAGIDLVIGATGSPLQLVLAGVYHADVPPGNIDSKELTRWAAHPMVASAIPLSLGDSYDGYRIVGTVEEFSDLYGATLQAGRFWHRPFEAVIGSNVAQSTGLETGDTFSGNHGLVASGEAHDGIPYRVVGQFLATDSVLDSLIVTSTRSVWLMHNTQHQGEHPEDGKLRHHQGEDCANSQGCDQVTEGGEESHQPENNEAHAHHGEAIDHDEMNLHFNDPALEDHPQVGDQSAADEADGVNEEVTLLLITLSSPLGMLSLPREVNAESSLQAASPAYELTRLLQIVGIGLNWLKTFAAVLVVSAALSIFAALYASLRARRHDLAVLRCLGASRSELFSLLFLEGFLLTVAGIVTGLCFAHGGMSLVGYWVGDGRGLTITGWAWAPEEFLLILGLLATGALTALLPAWQAYRTDVSRTLTAP